MVADTNEAGSEALQNIENTISEASEGKNGMTSVTKSMDDVKGSMQVLGKSIGDVLNMTINQAVEFFENVSFLQQKLKVLQDVGLGYVKLGQQCTTLSGGESQRIKLAAELAKKDTGKTLYILDEPTTGLHFEDINILLEVIQKLVNKGNSVIVIEHNLDVIKVADYLIDMGPGGGKEGGKIVATGTPEEVAECKKSETGKFLREELKR